MKSIIVLDIGTQFVKAGILELSKDKKQGNLKSWTKEFYSKDVFSACQKAIKRAQKLARIKAQEVFLGAGSDILRGKTTTICFKRKDSKQKIDIAELKYLVQKIEWRALENIRKEFSQETEIKDTDVRLINAFVIDIKVNNQSVSDPIGMDGENICFSIYNIYSSLHWLNSLEKLISELKLKLVGMIPIAYALFCYLNLEKSVKGNALIVDVGGKATEITLIRDGGETIETKVFHLGGQAFNRILANFLGINSEDAEIIKIKYSRGETSFEAKKKLERIFASNMSFWFDGAKIIFSDFLKEYNFLPGKIFLCGNASNFPLIVSNFKKEKKFKVFSIAETEEFEQSSCLALKKVYLETPCEKDIFMPIFRRVIKLIQNQ